MKTTLKPQEYYYLNSPLDSDPVEMLKYTFQGLCVSGHILLFYRNIYIHKNAKYKRRRVFTRLGPNFNQTNSYSKSEDLALSLYDKPELRLYELRSRLLKRLSDKVEKFRNEYVYQDLENKGLCTKKFFLTQKGIEEENICNTLLQEIERDIDSMLADKKRLIECLDGLGPNFIFLDKKVLEKLKKNSVSLSELEFLTKADQKILIDSSIFSGFDSFGAFDSFIDGGSDFDFGGGDFGGGGSGDFW